MLSPLSCLAPWSVAHYVCDIIDSRTLRPYYIHPLRPMTHATAFHRRPRHQPRPRLDDAMTSFACRTCLRSRNAHISRIAPIAQCLRSSRLPLCTRGMPSQTAINHKALLASDGITKEERDQSPITWPQPRAIAVLAERHCGSFQRRVRIQPAAVVNPID